MRGSAREAPSRVDKRRLRKETAKNATMPRRAAALLACAAAADGFARLTMREAESTVLERGQKPAMPPCPTKTAILSDGNKPVSWRVHNPMRIPMHIFWVGFTGDEQRMDSVRGCDNTSIETYVGHAWRLRTPDGILVAEAKSSVEPFVLQQCSEAYGAHKVHLPRALADVAAKQLLAVSEHWRGEALAGALAACDPWRFLSAEGPFVGCHVLCTLPATGVTPPAIALFADGKWSERPSALLPAGAADSLQDLVMLMQHTLDFPTREAKLQPPAFFTPNALKLPDLKALLAQPVALLYEGGQVSRGGAPAQLTPSHR